MGSRDEKKEDIEYIYENQVMNEWKVVEMALNVGQVMNEGAEGDELLALWWMMVTKGEKLCSDEKRWRKF